MFRKLYFTTMVIGIIAVIYIVCPGIFSGTGHPSNRSITPAQQADELISMGGDTAIFPAPALTTYQMDLYLDALKRTLYGQSVVQTSNTSGQVMNELWFTLYPRAFRNQADSPAPAGAYYGGFDAGDMIIQNVSINDEKADYQLEGVSLRVKLPRSILPQQLMKINIGWQSQIPRVSYRYGTSNGVFMLGNSYPILNVFTAQGWHTSVNSSFGDPFCFASANYLVRINLPQHFRLATSGQTAASLALDDGRVCHVLSVQQARDFCITAFGDCEVIQDNHDRVKISCYMPAGQSEEGRKIIAQSEEILDYYNLLWGAYPYPEFKIAVVPMQGFEGMEYSGLIYVKQDLLQNSDNLRNLLAHEIAHQWWYGLVGSDQVAEPWLDEGLASYGARLFMEAAAGAQKTGGKYSVVNLNRGLQDFADRSEYQTVVYQGGGAYWGNLENSLGRENVQKIMQAYLDKYRYGLASTGDLQKIIQQEVPQYSQLDPWFR